MNDSPMMITSTFREKCWLCAQNAWQHGIFSFKNATCTGLSATLNGFSASPHSLAAMTVYKICQAFLKMHSSHHPLRALFALLILHATLYKPDNKCPGRRQQLHQNLLSRSKESFACSGSVSGKPIEIIFL